jgi:16S rRNA (guanine527-N7)-methyltransferase
VDVSRETRDRLADLVGLLLRWNARINLIARADEDEIWHRHIADSLQLVPLMKRPARAIDLGSGGGFPGLVLALATGVPFTLIEADRRKAAFLAEAARVTKAPATIHAGRIEGARLAPAPLITARALSPIAELLAYGAPLLAEGGVCLFPKGATGESELTTAAGQWQMTIERFPSRTAPHSTIFRISEIARAGASVKPGRSEC